MLRPGDTLIIWKIDRLGRNLRDLVDIVAALEARSVEVKSLTNGIVDTTTAHGKLVFGMFALTAEYEAALIKERTLAGLAAARSRGRAGGRKPKDDPCPDRQGPADVRLTPIHHGRDCPILWRHP
ncbi:recombinase family protein [Nocardia sp. NPDC046763]|uniref:recombinase family protein n=1 Tax=Nocardia sp. NPDC046763 TaxID=3155256 RepID=UPI00340D6486